MAIDEIRYSPAQLTPVWRKLSPGSAPETETGNQAGSAASAGDAGSESPDVLSPAEQDFFEKLFPEAGNSVKTYSLYGQNGPSSASRPGMLLDRKG
jgi:hypothetical protein